MEVLSNHEDSKPSFFCLLHSGVLNEHGYVKHLKNACGLSIVSWDLGGKELLATCSQVWLSGGPSLLWATFSNTVFWSPVAVRYNSAKKDNDFIYHEAVPALDTLQSVKGRVQGPGDSPAQATPGKTTTGGGEELKGAKRITGGGMWWFCFRNLTVFCVHSCLKHKQK